MNKNYMKMELELFLSKMNLSSVPLGSLFKLNSVQFKFQNISGTAGTKFIELSSFTTLGVKSSSDGSGT